MRKTLVGLLFIIPLLLGNYAYAEPAKETFSTKGEMKQALIDLINDKSYINKINPYPDGSKKNDYFTDFMKRIFANDLIMTKMVDTMYQYQGKNIDIAKLTKAWMYENIKTGIVKLPYEDLTRYFELYARLLESSETIDECAQLSAGGMGKGFYEIIGRMDDDILNAWLKLVHKAIVYGLDTNREPPSLTKDQDEIAWEIMISNSSVYEVTKFSKVAKSPDSATSTETCWLGVYMISSLNKMTDEPKKWLTYSMINSMFK